MAKNHKGKSHHKSNHVSANSDNRKYCVAISRQKFCYETYEKAQKACEYSPNPQRIYYCDFCCAYHTTSMLSKKHFYTTRGAERNQIIRNKIEQRMNEQSHKTKKSEPIEKEVILNEIKHAGYNAVIEDCLVASVSKINKGYQSNQIRAKLLEKLRSLKNPTDSHVMRAMAETLRWPFGSVVDGVFFFILSYLNINGELVLRDTDEGIVDLLFDTELFSNLFKLNIRVRFLEAINNRLIIGTKTQDKAITYTLAQKM